MSAAKNNSIRLKTPYEKRVQENIPSTLAERTLLREQVERYAQEQQFVPPLPIRELRQHVAAMLAATGGAEKYRDYAAVLLNNALWRERFAKVPFARRLLLMPKCLRHEEKCPAPMDELGLQCQGCGLCAIQDLQEEAQRLGYAVLVAEGSAVVTSLIQTGQIEAVVGVSCLNVLEKTFPYMEAAAVPGVAIPLLQSDCRYSNVDMEWVWDLIHLTSADKSRRISLDGLQKQVDGWFTPLGLTKILGQPKTATEQIAQAWLAKAGKRWRPLLATCAYLSLQEDLGVASGVIPDDFRKIALAVECFHKASLIHDDIEDNDDVRYGEKTLHVELGTPVALNIGDLLIGEGYRLIASCDVEAGRKVKMLQVAAQAHHTLCLGQGAELHWSRHRQALSSEAVLDIFRQKTSPAFEVALRLGALYATDDENVQRILTRYSEALGVAYQIKDDLEDFSGGEDPDDLLAQRPTLPLALGHELSDGGTNDGRVFLESLWRGDLPVKEHMERLQALLNELGVAERTQQLYDAHKEQAVRCLRDLTQPSLKGLLRRVISKIFPDGELKGWCP